jgi:CRP-like cAMP-binding protein
MDDVVAQGWLMPRIVAARDRMRLPARYAPEDGDRGQLHNLILQALPKKELAKIFPSLELVRLKLHQVLHEPGERIRSVYFLNCGLGSVLTVQPDGKNVEVGLIGKEGFVGVPVVFGFKTSGLRVVTQGDGTAYRLDLEALRNVLPQCSELERALMRYAMILGMQSTQLAACNRLHNVVERLARWLLMSQDRIQAKVMPLTQEFLGQMLGARRASVSEAASHLKNAGMISYTRGSVTILNRAKLEKLACACYEIIKQQERRWQAEIQ